MRENSIPIKINYLSYFPPASDPSTRRLASLDHKRVSPEKHKDDPSPFNILENAQADLDSYNFGDPKITIFDSESSKPLSKVKIALIVANTQNNDSPCKKLESEIFRKGITDHKGEAIIHNLPVQIGRAHV